MDVGKKAGPWVFVGAMVLLPLSEWRFLQYQFFGARSFSLFHIIFLLVLAFLALDWKRWFSLCIPHLHVLRVIFLPLALFFLLLFVYPPWGLMVKTHGLGFSIIMMMGTMVALLGVPFFLFWKGTMIYTTFMFSIFLGPIIALTTSFIPWKPWLDLYDKTWFSDYSHGFNGYFSFPFLHPNHASFFVISIMFFLIGYLLSQRISGNTVFKGLATCMVIVETGMAIGLSGSRTGAICFIFLLSLYLAGYVLWFVWSREKIGKSAGLISPLYLVMGIVLSVALIGLNSDLVGPKRLSWLLDYNLSEIALGQADPARRAMWSLVGPLSDGEIDPLILEVEGFDAVAAVRKGGNLHSTFLDIYVWAGPIHAFCLLSFFLLLVGLSLQKLYYSWSSFHFPIFFALFAILLEILAYLYIQPVEYFAPLWVATGVILSCLLGYGQSAPENGKVT